MLRKLGLISIATVSAFAMHSVELNINDVDLEAGLKLDMAQFSNYTEPNSVFMGFKYLGGDGKNSDNYSESLDPLLEMNFLMQRTISKGNLKVGMGVKLVQTQNHDLDFLAIPLGLEASLKLPLGSVPIHFGGLFYYAPEVLSMQDAHGYLEYRVGFDIELIKNGHIQLGYRNIDTNYSQNRDFNYNSSAYAGFKFDF